MCWEWTTGNWYDYTIVDDEGSKWWIIILTNHISNIHQFQQSSNVCPHPHITTATPIITSPPRNFWFRQERCQVTKYIHKLYYITNKNRRKKPIFTFEKVGGGFLCTVEICERKYTGTKESMWYSCTRLILV